MASSCVGSENDNAAFVVSIKSPIVDSGKGQQFVNVQCSGNWTLYLTSEDGEVDWATLSVISGKGNKSDVILTYQANDSDVSRELKVILDNGSKWVECKLVQSSSEQLPEEDESDPGQSGSGNLNAAWLELPAQNNPELGYYTHSFTMDGKSYRNYSFGWSQKDRLALWIAYPLCSMYTVKKVNRTDAWSLDPLLGELSSAPFGGYAGSYARGHQVPSADRLCCYDANAQTFYGTNMTPQLNAHNEGIWVNLENKVRNIANSSDTTYVVTGVMVSSSSRKEQDSYGESVTIPDAYFKAVLRYSKGSTLGSWNAAGFYLEHRSYSEGLGKQHSMSIDELEEITGLDFFVNLPAKVGVDQAARIEAADPASSSVWW